MSDTLIKQIMSHPELISDAYDTVATEIIIATENGVIRNRLLERLNALDIDWVMRAEDFVLSTTEAGISLDVALILWFLERSTPIIEEKKPEDEVAELEAAL